MNTDTLNIDGYTVTIAHDESASNPMTEFDCEPPFLVFYDRGVTAYNGAPETLPAFVNLIPWSIAEHEAAYPGQIMDGARRIVPGPGPFDRGTRVKTLHDFLNSSVREFAEFNKGYGYGYVFRDCFAALLDEMHGGREPTGWRSAEEWFETASALLNLAGIPHAYEESNGYSQGDSVLCMAIATPEWMEKTGVRPEHAKSACEGAIKLYSAWAWGDVYGVESITDPDGNEIEGASCWGYYGSDHDESGLMDHARSCIEAHKQELAEQWKTENPELALA